LSEIHTLSLHDALPIFGFLHSSDEYKVMALASYGKPAFIKDFRDMIWMGNEGQYRIQQTELEARFGQARLRHEPFASHHFDIARDRKSTRLNSSHVKIS